jgi:hypothetical protein
MPNFLIVIFFYSKPCRCCFGFWGYFSQGLTSQPRLASNLQSSCLILPSTRITGMHHHARWVFELGITLLIFLRK